MNLTTLRGSVRIDTEIIHSHKYADWIFDRSHPTQGRRFTLAKEQLTLALDENDFNYQISLPRQATFEELCRVHSHEYVNKVLNDHLSDEWSGSRPDLSELASLFVGGTLVALEDLLNGEAKTAIHFPGAKHHAQYDHSSGFCVFADFAIAADIATKVHGKRVAILDIDAHHGDGTENLTAENPNVLTYSIHQWGIFPGTGFENNPDKNVYNFPLYNTHPNSNLGMGDNALFHGTLDFLRKFQDFKADLLFIACGADGHHQDPLSGLLYTVKGYERVAYLIRTKYPDLPILLGGAGGYLPDTRTPEVWSAFAKAII